MTEDQRLNIQYEILQLLADRYYLSYVEDREEAHDLARKDSYKIMKIIRDGLKEKSEEKIY